MVLAPFLMVPLSCGDNAAAPPQLPSSTAAQTPSPSAPGPTAAGTDSSTVADSAERGCTLLADRSVVPVGESSVPADVFAPILPAGMRAEAAEPGSNLSLTDNSFIEAASSFDEWRVLDASGSWRGTIVVSTVNVHWFDDPQFGTFEDRRGAFASGEYGPYSELNVCGGAGGYSGFMATIPGAFLRVGDFVVGMSVAATAPGGSAPVVLAPELRVSVEAVLTALLPMLFLPAADSPATLPLDPELPPVGICGEIDYSVLPPTTVSVGIPVCLDQWALVPFVEIQPRESIALVDLASGAMLTYWTDTNDYQLAGFNVESITDAGVPEPVAQALYDALNKAG